MACYYTSITYFRVDEVIVPDVIDKSVNEAARILRKQGLKGEINLETHHIQIPKGFIISQDPQKGSMVKKNRIINLEVSNGPEKNKIPNVMGLTLREAEVEITNGGFRLSPTIDYVFDSSVPENIIIKQIPSPNVMKEAGTEINLIVSRGKEDI
jgi:serine/threonine-protein kinase